MQQIFILFVFTPLLFLPIQIGRLMRGKSHCEKLTFWLSMLPLAISAIGVVGLSINELTHQAWRFHLFNWFESPIYHYEVQLVVDELSLVYSALTAVLLATIAYFSKRYLHKDAGFHRFYLLLSSFGSGLLLASYAGSISLLLVGWEIVGLTSVLLISFFTYRQNPAKNALYVFVIYRSCDIGLVAAALLLHTSGTAHHFELTLNAPWFGLLTAEHVTTIGFCLLFAAAGKAALFPFSSWMPRAMEGPTPSSAIFYGALSVHLAPLLLLRAAPVFSEAPILRWALLAIGILTLLIGFSAWRVQSDIKSRLAFGAVTQLGFIVCEIALQLHEIALVHIASHAVLRTLQILRAPSLLHDYEHINQMLGHSFTDTSHLNRSATLWQRFNYRLGLERGFLDWLWVDQFVGRLGSAIRFIDRLDERIAQTIGGETSATQTTSKQAIEEKVITTLSSKEKESL